MLVEQFSFYEGLKLGILIFQYFCWLIFAGINSEIFDLLDSRIASFAKFESNEYTNFN